MRSTNVEILQCALVQRGSVSLSPDSEIRLFSLGWDEEREKEEKEEKKATNT